MNVLFTVVWLLALATSAHAECAWARPLPPRHHRPPRGEGEIAKGHPSVLFHTSQGCVVSRPHGRADRLGRLRRGAPALRRLGRREGRCVCLASLLLWGSDRPASQRASHSTGTKGTVASSSSAGVVGGPARAPVGSWRRADSVGGSGRATGEGRPPDGGQPAERGSALLPLDPAGRQLWQPDPRCRPG
jgi:hypothetical protein